MDGTCKLTDGGSNTINISCTIEEVDSNFNVIMRSIDNTLKSYNIEQKKKFNLSVKNINSADKTTLETIYNLKSALYFYRNTSDVAATATVRWIGDFNLLTPTNRSYSFLTRIYEGSIVLEEV
jgi:hypothetical protein